VEGFVREYAFWLSTGIIYLLLALLEWILGGILQRRDGMSMPSGRPEILIHLPRLPPSPLLTFDSFPPLYEPPDGDDCGLVLFVQRYW
jgi:hypothetical protein